MLDQLKFYWKAHNSKGHGIHPPFVYRFVTELLNDDRYYYLFDSIDYCLKQWQADKRTLTFSNGSTASVQQLAASLPPKKYIHLLFRSVLYFKPTQILDICVDGAGWLGLSTCLLAGASPEIKVTSLVNNYLVATLVKQELQEWGIQNAAVKLLQEANGREEAEWDFICVHLTANTRFEQVEKLLLNANDTTLIVFLGINEHFTKNAIWAKIIAHISVTCAISTWRMGFIFFRKEQLVKQHFAIRF